MMSELTQTITELMNTQVIQNFLSNLVNGEITILTALVWFVIAGILSIIGGAIGGILLARKDLGYELSAMIGGLFGPVGVLPAIAVGLIVLKLV